MTKDKSQHFCSTVKCQCLVFLLTAGCIAAAVCVALLSTAVRGRMPPDMEWWQTTIIYQIYPRSFMDSNNDGIGDIRGIISKLDHFTYLNVKAIWISPVYESPMKDFGYDISNFTNVAPIFGNLTDMANLIEEAHKRGLKVILDFVPNHSSNLHMWFNESVKGTPRYKDYYVWRDGIAGPNGTHSPPNNWLSVFKNSAWEWNEERKQYYYHAFLKEQPDLNYRNPALVEEMQNALRFWLERGVDGFRIDALPFLFEVTNTSWNEPLSNRTDLDPTQYDYLTHPYTQNLMDDMYKVLAGWRDVLDEYENLDDKRRFMVVEAYTKTTAERIAWYKSAADMPFYFGLLNINKACGGSCIRDIVDEAYKDLPANAWANFVFGNHDNRRVSTKKGPEFVNALNMLLLTLKGTPTTYYGEEIGMLDVNITYNQSVDPQGKVYNESVFLKYSRDPERSPMQWSNDTMAGFTNSTTSWLPVGSNYRTINVETEKDAEGFSTIKLYRTLAKLREEPPFKYGLFKTAVVNNNTYSYLRHAMDFPQYLIAINFGSSTDTSDYTKAPVNAEKGVVVANTGNVNATYNVNSNVDLSRITLNSAEGLVIKIINAP
ncbi:probable maltase [Haliotis rufescens]|uniref:probable maltase n=1 Tax=Haliotis rufescens TaxID=6454 RepID=UPI00201F05B8|nr:probable maltase [Haliotis rufescens]XP_046368702.2 probable maltase [Haliotis rufescens]